MNSCGLCGRAYQLPGLQSGRDQEITCPLGRGPRQRGCLDLDEPAGVEHVASRLVDLAAQPEGRVGAASPQVEVAVLEPRFLADLYMFVDREREGSGRAEHLDVAGDDLDITRGQVGVLVALGAQADRAGHLQAVLAAEVVRHRLVADDDLDHAAGLAQVDERHSPVVAPARDPSGEDDFGVDVGLPEAAGVVGADHCCSCWLRRTRGCRSSTGGVHVLRSTADCSPLRMSLTSGAWSAAPGKRT